MNNLQLDICRFNASVFDEIYSGYISSHTVLQFIEADQSPYSSDLAWLELNLVSIERYVTQGQIFEIQSECDTISIHSKNEFYQWCRVTLSCSYALYLRNLHY